MHIKEKELIKMISNKYNIRRNKVEAVTRNFFITCSDNSIKMTTMVKILNDNKDDWKTKFVDKMFDAITDIYGMNFDRLYVDV